MNDSKCKYKYKYKCNWKGKGKEQEYVDVNVTAKDVVYASYVVDRDLTKNKSHHHDPLLKLYYDMLVMINHNMDVAKYEAKGHTADPKG